MDCPTAGEHKDVIEVHENPTASYDAVPDFLKRERIAPIVSFHRSMPAYEPTPLAALRSLAKALGVSEIFIKDESKRFGLNAFKGLGGSYALFRSLCDAFGLEPRTSTFATLQKESFKKTLADMMVVTATDGNHGKGVAWAASLLGCKATIYMPRGSSPERVRAIERIGRAVVRVTDCSYDDTVRLAASDAARNGWLLIQDTSWTGYETVPTWIIQGYTTLAAEALEQMAQNGVSSPTHVFLQAGVGSMAGGILGCLADTDARSRPVFSIVEPASAACIHASAKYGNGKPLAVRADGSTIMAGLNCGEPCPITWPALRDFAGYYFSCPDYVAAEGMRAYARPLPGDPAIISGESGAVTLGLLLHIMTMPSFAALRARMRLTRDAVILLINTEGDTAPECYKAIVEKGAFPSPFLKGHAP